MVGEAPLNPTGRLRWRCAFALAVLTAPAALGQGLVARGGCRDGEPNGAYELRTPDGRLRVAGAFAKGRRTGTFIFWAANGARIAVVPYDNERKSGTVAVWFPAASAVADAPRRSETAYVDDRLHGVKRSWFATGRPRTDLRYVRGELVEARAWVEAGAPLPEADARAIAERDVAADDGFYATLEALVADNRPKCE